jgi:hypothetical protein
MRKTPKAEIADMNSRMKNKTAMMKSAVKSGSGSVSSHRQAIYRTSNAADKAHKIGLIIR